MSLPEMVAKQLPGNDASLFMIHNLTIRFMFSAVLVASLPWHHSVVAQTNRNIDDRILDNIFRIPNTVTLSEKQRAELAKLREKHGPELAKELRKLMAEISTVYTDEQRRMRTRVTQEIRKLRLSPDQSKTRINEALGLTKEQQSRLAQLKKKQRTITEPVRRQIQTVVATAQSKEKPPKYAVPPTHSDQKYGPHARHVYDVWLAESSKPAPILLSIHGGGFRSGNRGVNAKILKECLDNGISVVALTYRLSTDAIMPSSFDDVARAVQTIRYQSKAWNLDPERIASSGNSAGAGLSLWLAFHDDLAKPDSKDPVARESTRLTCAFVYEGQGSYDPRVIRGMFPGTDVWKHRAFSLMFGVDLEQLDSLPAEKYRLMELVSPIHHLTSDDPPVVLTYRRPFDVPITNQSIGIHHPDFGVMLKKQMDRLKIECHVYADGVSLDREPVMSEIEFLKQQFKMD